MYKYGRSHLPRLRKWEEGRKQTKTAQTHLRIRSILHLLHIYIYTYIYTYHHSTAILLIQNEGPRCRFAPVRPCHVRRGTMLIHETNSNGECTDAREIRSLSPPNRPCPTITSTTAVCSTCIRPQCMEIETVTPGCGCAEQVATVFTDHPCEMGCPGGCAGTEYIIATESIECEASAPTATYL